MGSEEKRHITFVSSNTAGSSCQLHSSSLVAYPTADYLSKLATETNPPKPGTWGLFETKQVPVSVRVRTHLARVRSSSQVKRARGRKYGYSYTVHGKGDYASRGAKKQVREKSCLLTETPRNGAGERSFS